MFERRFEGGSLSSEPRTKIEEEDVEEAKLAYS